MLKDAAPLESRVVDAHGHSVTVASIILCVYNRYDYLNKLLEKLVSLETIVPCEILIVDNSDNVVNHDAFYNQAVLSDKVRVVHSSPPGLSRARNIGFMEACGRYVLYLDDDAVPVESWLDDIVAVFDQHTNAAVVGGPIEPIWPSQRPDWIPTRYEGCLTILDHGEQTKKLGEWEYVYGANIAFRKDALKGIGGFDTELGRNGSGALLSSEEIVVQDRLRREGWESYYSGSAKVLHHVHEERINQSWFRRRMAWQVASNILSGQPSPSAKQSLHKAVNAAHKLGIDPSFLNAFASVRNSEAAEAQIDFLMALTESALCVQDQLPDTQLMELRGAKPDYKPPGSSVRIGSGRDGNASRVRFASAPPIIGLNPGATIFVELSPGHDYLYDAFVGLGNTYFLKSKIFPWAGKPYDVARDIEALLESAFRAAQSCGGRIFFLTLDVWLSPVILEVLHYYLASSGVPVFGIAHRIDSNSGEIEILRSLSKQMQGIFSLSPHLGHHLEEHNVENVHYLPHPATSLDFPALGRDIVRDRLGVPKNAVVLSMLGELREGKGLKLLLSAIPLLNKVVAKDIFFVFGGKSGEDVNKEIELLLNQYEIGAVVDFRHFKSEREFRGLSDFEFSDYLAMSDIGLLLYVDGQRHVMSGILPNYIARKTPVLTTRNSFCGRMVEEQGWGLTLENETGEVLAQALESAVYAVREGRFSSRLEVGASQFSKEVIVGCLKNAFGL